MSTEPLPTNGAEFGQISPLTTTLRNILRDYSGAQLLNELLQNADDAGAREFKVMLDCRARAHPRDSLISPALASAQGPALYQFDDAAFSPDDFASIQRVGDGRKLGDPTRTGQFGLGFNAVYHVTDVPTFASGRHLVVFDPHQTHLHALVQQSMTRGTPSQNPQSITTITILEEVTRNRTRNWIRNRIYIN